MINLDGRRVLNLKLYWFHIHIWWLYDKLLIILKV